MIEVLIDEQFTMSVPAIDGVTTDSKVTIALRPEKLAIHPPRPEKSDTLSGRVEEIVYIGTDTRYMVRLSDQSSVVIRVQNLGEGMTVFEAGDQVSVTWDSDSARLLTE
jgi:spermidine/putrescine transport system ATP-binding protein